MQKLIHFLDISIFNKCEIKLFLFGSQQLIGKAQVLFYLGTKITLSDYPFFFFLTLFEDENYFFFQTVGDGCALNYKHGRAECQFCAHISER